MKIHVLSISIHRVLSRYHPNTSSLISLLSICSIHVSIYRSLPWHIPRYLPIDRTPLACISYLFFFMFFIFYSLCVHSILFSCFSCRSMVPCSPCFLYVSFLSISGHFFFFFGFLCPLTIVTKRGRNLSFECHSSRGVIDLGGELHVIGKKIFEVTNLGGELVWYTLIYFEMCIFVLRSYVMIEIFLLFILLALWIKIFLSLVI